jgi:RNA recognition motif-containing protein
MQKGKLTPKPKAPTTKSHKLFVGGLIPTCEEGNPYRSTSKNFLDTIRQYFQEFGPLADFELVREKKSGEPRGFAFIYYADPEDAQKCLKATHYLYERRVIIFSHKI